MPADHRARDRIRQVTGTVRFRVTALAVVAVAAVLLATGMGLVTAQRRLLTDKVEELGIDLLEAREPEVDVDWIGIVVDSLEVRLLGADTAILQHGREANAAALDHRGRSRSGLGEGRRQQQRIQLRNGVLAAEPVGPAILLRWDASKRILQAGVLERRLQRPQLGFIVHVADSEQLGLEVVAGKAVLEDRHDALGLPLSVGVVLFRRAFFCANVLALCGSTNLRLHVVDEQRQWMSAGQLDGHFQAITRK